MTQPGHIARPGSTLPGSAVTDELIAHIRTLLAEATPGPWPLDRVDEVDDPGWTVECSRWRGFLNTVDFGPDRATARLVSEAPALLAQLLATVEDLRRSTH